MDALTKDIHTKKRQPGKISPRKLTEELLTPLPKQPIIRVARCELRPTCKICATRGWSYAVRSGVVVADVCSCVKECRSCAGLAQLSENGQARPCHEPSPLRMNHLVNEASMPARYLEAQISQFANMSGNGKDVLERVRVFVEKYRPGGRGMIVSGPVGVGKTFLLVAMSKALLERGISVKFIDFFQLLSELRAAYARDESDLDVLGHLMHCDVLVIDELGKGRNTDWELTILDQLIMGRYNQRTSIVASTNYQLKPSQQTPFQQNFSLGSPQHNAAAGFGSGEGHRDNDPYGRGAFSSSLFEALDQRVGQRIYSRLQELCEFVEWKGPDYRQIISQRLKV